MVAWEQCRKQGHTQKAVSSLSTLRSAATEDGRYSTALRVFENRFTAEPPQESELVKPA